MKRWCNILICLLLCMTFASFAAAEGLSTLPQIDNSTARIPITDAIYAHFTGQGAAGPAPICSKTHGAWLNLADGKADIIFLVAPTEEEMQYFADAGVDIEMKIYGYDGLVFMGNASNPTDNLTSSEIRSIYRGDITDWGAVQDSSVSGDIAVYIRNPESGSQRLFEKLVWTGYEMPDFQSMGFQEGEVQGTEPYKMEEISDMSTITTTVMQNRFSIGYNIMSYVDNVFLSDEVETSKVVTTGSVNLREWASLDAGVIATLPAGTELEYSGYTVFDDRDIAWYRVNYEDNDYCWVSSRYAELQVDNDSLKLFNIDGYAPTTENFANGNYPFVTTSYVAIRADEPDDSPARQLYNWIGSEESRAIIEENSTLSVAFSDSIVIRAAQSDTARPEVGAIIEKLASQRLQREELYGFTEEELVLIWQGAHAYAGKIFYQADCQSYFGAQEWYDGQLSTYAQSTAAMDGILLENYTLISQYLSELRRGIMAVMPRTFAYSVYEDNMTGEDVLQLQDALIALHYLEQEYRTGEYDEDTRDAVSHFQIDNGLEETGVFDETTRDMLF